ncbi:MAG: ArsR/SmtB family transcription factor [Nitrososphaerales archaeon]
MKLANVNANSKSVQSLIQLGYCQPSDIKHAMIDGERLSSPEYVTKIRQLERQLKMLGESNRIKILLLLSKREMCVCELESALKLPQPTISHHVGLLEYAGLLERSKKGKFVFYKLNVSSPISKLLEEMLG